MIKFNKGKEITLDTYTIQREGDKLDYLDTINALLTLICLVPKEDVNSCEINEICRLIKDMLPDESQIIDAEDAELLKILKINNK